MQRSRLLLYLAVLLYTTLISVDLMSFLLRSFGEIWAALSLIPWGGFHIPFLIQYE